MSEAKTASRSIYIDQTSAELALERLSKSAEKLEASIKKGEAAGKNMSNEIKKLGDTQASIKQVQEAIEKGLRPSLTQQQQLVTRLRNELKRMSEDAPGYATKFEAYRKATAEMNRLKESFDNVGKAQKTWLSDAKTVAFGVLVGNTVQSVVQSIGSYVSGMVSGNAKLADSLADIEKATGLSSQKVAELNSQLSKIDTRTPTAELRNIAVALGQLGVAATAENVQAIDKIVVALGDEFGGGAEEITKNLSVLRNNLKDLQTGNYGDDVAKIGNALNVLGAEGLATAPVVTDIANRMAGVASTFKLSSGEILGTAATFQELGIEVERGSTAFTKILQKIAAEPEKFAKVAGVSVKEFTNLVNTDMLGAFTKVAEGAGKASGSNVVFAKVLKELDADGSGAGEVLSKLSKNSELLASKVDLASNALTNQSSITEEFNKKNNNLAANLEKLEKRLSSIFANSGLANFINYFIKSFYDMVAPVQTAVQRFDELQTSVTNLEKNISPLADRYDELQAKATTLGGATNLSKKEQEEMKGIVEQITNVMPGAVTQFDEYGKAIAISTDRVRDFIKIEKDRLKVVNADAIKENQKNLDQIISQINNVGKQIKEIEKSGTFLITVNTTGDGVTASSRQTYQRAATAAEVREKQAIYQELLSKQRGYQAEVKRLNGEALEEQVKAKEENEKVEPIVNPFGNNEESKKRDQALADFKKWLQDLQTELKNVQLPDTTVIRLALKEAAELKKLDEMRAKANISTQQYLEAKKLIEEKYAQEVSNALRKEAEKMAANPVNLNQSIIDQTSLENLPDQLRQSIEALPKVIAQMPVMLAIPELTPEEKKKLEDGFKQLEENLEAGRKLRIAQAKNPTDKRDAELDKLEADYYDVFQKIEQQRKEVQTGSRKEIDETLLLAEEEYNQKRQDVWSRYTQAIAQDVVSGLSMLSQAFNILQSFEQIATARENANFQAEQKRNDQRRKEIDKLQKQKLISEVEARRRIAELDRKEAAEKEELERKQRERQKKYAIAQALINGALSVTNIWATTPKTDFGVSTFILLGLSALATLASVAQIASSKFARGGYTGSGYGSPDNTGYRPAGIVHEGEYVVPKNILGTSKGAAMVQQLEEMRTGSLTVQPFWKNRPYMQINVPSISESFKYRKYADGGFVTSPQAQGNDAMLKMLVDQMKNQEQVNMMLAGQLERLSTRLDNPVTPVIKDVSISLKKIDDAYADREGYINEGAFR